MIVRMITSEIKGKWRREERRGREGGKKERRLKKLAKSSVPFWPSSSGDSSR